MKPLFTLITLQHLQIPTVGGDVFITILLQAGVILYLQSSANYDRDYQEELYHTKVFFNNGVCVLHSLARTSAVAVALLHVGLVALVPH